MFKYSICSYSTKKWPNQATQYIRLNTASVLIQHSDLVNRNGTEKFKYSICSYSTYCKQIEGWRIEEFKYSICSYSTYLPIIESRKDISLNTASVLIQRPARTNGVRILLV